MVRSSSVGELCRLSRGIVQIAVLFLLISQSSQSGVRSGGDLFNLIEKNVVDLAQKVGEIYPSPCGTGGSGLKSCKLNLCTQDECRPLTSNVECVNVAASPRCEAHFPSCKNSSIRFSKERSGMTYPRAKIDNPPDKPQARSICGTTDLDQTFKKLYSNSPYHTDYYVGFTDGSRRLYPGREEADQNSAYQCTAYDSRKRPWYNAAISHPNHLVILVDTAYVPLDASYVEQSDALSMATDFARVLLYSVYYGDRINVVDFNSQAVPLVPSSIEVKYNQTDPQYHEELQVLETELQNLKPSGQESGPSSNLRSGLEEALKLLGGPDQSIAKNIIVFTSRGILQDESLNKTLDEVVKSLVRLFIFSMKSTDENLQDYIRVANRTRGLHVSLPSASRSNPLYHMRSYFNYLASMQALSGRSLPFWTPVYSDYYDIGKIITVAAPAFSYSSDYPRKFLGVASIDVLYDEIDDPAIRADFDNALKSRPVNEGVFNETLFNLTMPYDDSSGDSCDDFSAVEEAICPSDAKPAISSFLDRFCCETCSAGSSHDSKVCIYIGSSIGGVLFLALVSVPMFFFFRKRNSQAPIKPVEADASVQNDCSPLPSPRTPGKGPPVPNAGGKLVNGDSGAPHRIHQTLSRLCVDTFQNVKIRPPE